MTTETILQLLSIPILAIALVYAVWHIWTGLKWLREQRRRQREEDARRQGKDSP